jgi:hypothetical protein
MFSQGYKAFSCGQPSAVGCISTPHFWRQADIGPQDPPAIVFGFLFDLFHVDGDAAALDFNEPAVAFIADQGFCLTPLL